MTAVGIAGYGIAGLSFLFLAALVAIGWRGQRIGGRLIAASAITAGWAFVLALQSRLEHMPLLVVYVAEIVRDAAWLLVLTELARNTAPRFVITGTHVLWIGLLILGIAAPALPALGIQLATPSLLVSRAVDNGDIRLDIDPLDLLRAVMGVADAHPGWQNTARRLIDIMLQGMKPSS